MRRDTERRPKAWLLAGASGFVLVIAPFADAQEGGLWANLDLSSRLAVDDNLQKETPPLGVTTSLDNAFAFSLTSRKSTQSLNFSASGIARAAQYPGGTTLLAIHDPSVRLSYAREASSSALRANASYLLEDLSFVDWTETVSYSFDDFLANGSGSYSDWIASLGSGDETSYLVSGGTRETLSFGASYEFGVDAAFGGSIGYSHSQIAYTDANPGLVDGSTDRVTGTARFEITPTLSGSATYVVTQTNTGGTPEQSQSLRFGVGQDFNSGLIGLTLRSDLAGTTKASASRSLDWSTGILSFDAGLAATPGGAAATLGLGYRQDMKDGVIGASLSRDASASGVSNSMRASYRYAVNSNSQVSVSFNYSDNLPFGGGTGDQRAKLSASYSRDITDEIYVSAGYSLDFLDAADADPAFSNGVFVGIGRSYSFRPR